MSTAIFYIFSIILLTSALLVITAKKLITSVLCLAVTMFCLSVLYILLDAYLIATIQLLLYAGAVIVLFLSVIMLFNLNSIDLNKEKLKKNVFIGAIIGILFFIIFITIHSSYKSEAGNELNPMKVGVIARQLFTTYLLPFEMISFLIIAAIIGVVSVTKKIKV